MANTQVNVNGYNMKIKDNGDGTYSTTAVSLQQEITAVNALAITDTVAHDTAVDVSMVSGRKALLISNGLNVAATVAVYCQSTAGTCQAMVASGKSIAAGTSGMISSADSSLLLEPMPRYLIRITCSTAPTSGSITVWVEGVSA